MNGQLQDQINALREGYNALRRNSDLTQVTDEEWSLSRKVTQFEARIGALRQSGYVFTATLTNTARNSLSRWQETEIEFDRVLREYRYDMQDYVHRVEDAIATAERSPDAQKVSDARQEVGYATSRLSEAQGRLMSIYEPVQRDIQELDARLGALEWSIDQEQAATFRMDPGEHMIIATPAEWNVSDQEKTEMDGVLYLTDRRLLFEEKEKTGAFLGLFGGRKKQELKWAAKLDEIEDVRAEDRGLFGATHMLYVRLAPGARRAEITIEIKRSADKQEWLAFIQRAKSGGYSAERSQDTSF